MTENTGFDRRRSDAIRDLIVTTARRDRENPPAHKRIALLVGLVVSALLLSGGGVAFAFGTRIFAPEPTPIFSPEPAPSPTRTPTPTTTPTPASAVDPADTSTWTIGFGGIGPVRLGSALEEERQTLTNYFSEETDPVCAPVHVQLVTLHDLSILLVAGRTEPTLTAAVIVTTDWWAESDVSGTPTTSAGIGLGASEQQLMTTYPGITKTGAYNDTTTYYGLTDGRGAWIVFRVVEGKVNSIQVAHESNIPSENARARTMPSERCPA